MPEPQNAASTAAPVPAPTATAPTTPDANATPPTGDSVTPPTTTGDASTSDTAPTSTVDPQIAALRKESAGYRTRAKKAEAENEAAKLAQLSDLEKAQKEAADNAERATAAEQRAQQKALANAVTIEAHKTGLNVELAQRLISGVKFDEDGEPVEVDKAIAELATKYPELIVTQGGASAGGATGAASSNNAPTTETVEARNERLGLTGSGPDFWS